MNMLTNKLHGFALDGSVIKHEDLDGEIGAAKARRDALAQNGGTPEQLKALDNMIGIYQADLDAKDTHAASVAKQKKQADLDVENSPDNQSLESWACLLAFLYLRPTRTLSGCNSRPSSC
jgi:phage tail tube protein FII